MDENQKEKRRQEIAIFRYGVISDFVNGTRMSRAERKRMMREKCSRRWQIPNSEKTSISAGTIYKWIRDYTAGGGQLESLIPSTRSDQSRSRALDDDTGTALMELRQGTTGSDGKELIRKMIQLKRVTPGIALKKTTLHRFLKQNGLMEKNATCADRRKFEAELPNDLWQSDVMHGPYVTHEGKRRKTYLIAIIDDHSRLIPYARFYISETLISYLDALYHALARRGLPRRLYVDNGAAFKSHKLQYVTAALNITLIHARVYHPEGKGYAKYLIMQSKPRKCPIFNALHMICFTFSEAVYLSNFFSQASKSSSRCHTGSSLGVTSVYALSMASLFCFESALA